MLGGLGIDARVRAANGLEARPGYQVPGSGSKYQRYAAATKIETLRKRPRSQTNERTRAQLAT